MLGLHVTDECLEQFFVCFSTLLRMYMNQRGGILYQFDRNNLSVVLTYWHIGSVTIYILLLIHCIYIPVTKPTCTAFSAWLNTSSIISLKVTGKAIMLCSMALPSKICAALRGQSNVG